MSNNRDRRVSRGRTSNANSGDDSNQEPTYFTRPIKPLRPSKSSSNSVDVDVLWFDPSKGFGFAKSSDGTEAFLHMSALTRVGIENVAPGDKLRVQLEQGQKGIQVEQVLHLVASGSDQTTSKRHGLEASAEKEAAGKVELYKEDRGFGFIRVEGLEKNVFVHASALKQAGISTLTEGQAVLVVYGEGKKGIEARSVRLA